MARSAMASSLLCEERELGHSHWFAVGGLEFQLVAVGIDNGGLAVTELTAQHHSRELVEHFALDQALERAGAEDGVVAAPGEPVPGGVSDLEVHLALGKALVDPFELDIDDIGQLLLR